MKKRLLAWLLTLTLVVGILPAVALAETTGEESAADTSTESSDSVALDATNGTVTIDEASYKLYLGQGTQTGDSLGWWLDPVNRGLIPDSTDSVNEFRYYLFLRGSNGAEASEEIYKQFWTVCQMTDTVVTVNGQSDASGVTVGEISTFSDGYHKYIPVSVTGERGGTVSVTIKHVGGATYTLTKNFQYTQATELTLNADSNTYSISIDSANAGQSYFYYIDLGEAQTVTVSGTLADDPVGRLVLAQTAEGTDESMLWWRWNSDSSANQATQTVTTDKILLRVVGNDGGTISGTVTVTAAQSDSNTPSGGDGQGSQNNYAAYVGDYVIGFVSTHPGNIKVINENYGLIYGYGTREDNSNVPYTAATQASIAAATKRVDSSNTTIYDIDSNVTSGLTINKLWLETVSGDDTTFSWSDSALVKELSSVQGQSAQLYVREGRNCRALVYAEVTGTINGETFTKTVCTAVSLTITEFLNQTRPDTDTVEQLNAFLKELAGKIDTTAQTGTLYHIYLGNTTYEGTVVVPEAITNPYACIHFHGKSGNGGKTVIKGGIDLNGAHIERISNVHFVASETEVDSDGKTKALYGSGLRDVLNCSFYGYDIALDSSEGLINARGSVFVNNGIAALININDSMNSQRVLPADWNGNTFINNRISVRILSLTKRVSPYYFRIYDSNFISTNDDLDFDVQCEGHFYMYNNFYGQVHSKSSGLSNDELLNALSAVDTEDDTKQLVTSNSAKIDCDHSVTKVTVNPKMKLLVLGTWQTVAANMVDTASAAMLAETSTSTYENVQVIDPALDTRIINDEADELEADATTFADAEINDETIQMDVVELVDEEEVLLGTWTFD